MEPSQILKMLSERQARAISLFQEGKAIIEDLRWADKDDKRWPIIGRMQLLLKNFDLGKAVNVNRCANVVAEIDQAIKQIRMTTDVYDEMILDAVSPDITEEVPQLSLW